MKVHNLGEVSLTYDDVLLKPSYSEVLPGQVQINTILTSKMSMKIPLISAAMDTVTESRVAIIMAQEGGIGIIHKNLSIEEQALEVEKVKKYESGMIENPVTVRPDDVLHKVVDIMRKNSFSGVPVTEKDGKLVGIITNRDLRFEKNFSLKAADVMTKDKLITAPLGTSLEKAQSLLQAHRIEKLLIVDDKFFLKGLITVKDIEKSVTHPNSHKDEQGRLRVGAAVGVGAAELERAEALVEKGVDLIGVDSAHGHSQGVLQMVKKLKSKFNIQVMAGNVATKEGAQALIDSGADVIKVGVGPGSICTTRVISGVGVPQFSAVLECSEVCKKNKIPLVADGGIKYSGDIVKALAAGADSVMIGSLFAGTDEGPGEMIFYQGRSFKTYRGMGSIGAMKKGSKDRYFQDDVEDMNKLVPEGIEGRIPYRGPLADNIFQLLGGLRSGMGYLGASSLNDLREKANFVRISVSGLRESHPHDVIMTKDSTNYHIGS